MGKSLATTLAVRRILLCLVGVVSGAMLSGTTWGQAPASAKPSARSEAPASDTAKPDAAKPDAAKPDAAKPDAAKPDAAKSEAGGNFPAPPIKYYSQAALGKGLTRAELTSGLTVLVQENHAAPVTTVRCYVRNTGSAFEGQYLGMGLSHLLEHLVALGSTTKRKESEAQKILDTMGGQTNAFTSTDLTAFYIDCPARHTDQAIELIADCMQYAEIPEAEYRREMGVVQRELEMGEAERGRMLHQATKGLIFQEHPIRHPTIGYLSVVQQVKREEVIAFYRERYVPQNLVFVVAGDVNTPHVLEEVLKNFQDFRRTTERGVVLPVEPDQASPRTANLEMEGPTTNFAIAWPTVPTQDPDMYALDVASYVLTNGDSSRLGNRLKIDQPLAIDVDSSSYTPGFVKGWFEVAVQCDPGKLEACRKIIDEEIERLKQELVPADELAKVKRQKAAEHVFAQQQVQQQADSVAMSLISTGDPLFDDRYVEGIQSVTPEQVRDVARRYFVAHRRNSVTIDPLGTRRTSAEKGREYEETPVIRKQLPNGLTVLLKRHTVTPVVSIQAFVKGGILVETAENNGVASLTSELMSRGTKKYTGFEIAEYFDSVGGSFGTSSQRNTSFLQCLVLKDNWETALDYAYEVLFQPTLSPDEFAKIKVAQLERIAARQANPQAEIMDYWIASLPADNPYSRSPLGTEKSVSSLQVSDCRAYHAKYFVPNNMVLSIFGDIDPDQVLAVLEKSFGAQPKTEDFQFPTFPAAHANVEGSAHHLVTQKANTAMLVIGVPTVPLNQLEPRAALDVLNSVLTGGGGIGGRLFNELRGEQLVYYVYGQELTGPAPGFFFFLAQTRPDTLADVTRRIQANVARIAKEGIPQEEFELAKSRMIAAHAMQNVTPQSQAFEASVDELLGLGYDYDRTYDERIAKVQPADVQELVRRYFQRAIMATSSPEPNKPSERSARRQR